MTHPAYVYAKLNPKNVRFDVGSGGAPDLTESMAAAGVAFTPKGLGRELAARKWNPAFAELTAENFKHLIDTAMFAEFSRRMEALVHAQIREQLANNAWSRRRARALVAEAQKDMWPRLGPTYGLMGKAVVTELCDPRKCPDCNGLKFTMSGAKQVKCKRCEATGDVERGPVWRAEQLKMAHQSFRAHWEDPYKWLLTFFTEELDRAGRDLDRATADN